MRPAEQQRPTYLPPPVVGPWNSDQMTWTNPSYSGVMQFNATSHSLQNVPDPFNSRALNHHKRKSELIPPRPTKQFINEEKMAATLNGLHISSSFTSHNTNNSTSGHNHPSSSSDDSMDADIEFNYPINSKELQEKLQRANRITICEEFKTLNKDDPIIPKALLEHHETPCKALVIWQPPSKIKDLIVNVKNVRTSEDDDEDTNNNGMDNNNTSSIDLNNLNMDTDGL